MAVKKNNSGILNPGTTFEKYTVEKLLGRGGMGAVYLVRHNVLDSQFALKVLSPEVAEQNRQFVDRFIREAKLACKIRHPNLIAVHDAGKNPANGMYYIVMDYVSGGSVRELLKREHRVPPEKALAIIAQIAGALEVAHAHRMVHRDIKPDNIMFAADGTAKLADLGIAKSTDEQDTMLTMAASVFGTPSYMSPEQAMDSSKVDIRADIYSLGIVFYEMLAGKRPYHGDSSIQILSQVVAATEIPDIRTVCPEIPADLAELIAGMTAKKLENRIPNPTELLRHLKCIRIPSGMVVTPPGEGHGDHAVDVTLPTVTGGGLGRSPASAPAPGDVDVTLPTLVTGESGEDSGRNGEAPYTVPTVTIPAAAAPGASPKSSPARSAAAAPVAREVDKTVALEDLPDRERYIEALAEQSRQAKRKKIVLLICIVLFAVIICAAAGLGIWFVVRGRIAKPVSGVKPEAPVRAETPPSSPERKAEENTVRRPEATSAVPPADVPAATSAVPPADVPAATTPDIVPAAAALAPETPQIASDPLVKGGIVLLSGPSGSALAAKGALTREFGDAAVSLQAAESMGGYKEMLKAIIKSSPSVVIIAFADKYARERISKSSFENIIRHHADQLHDNAIPFIFMLSPESGGEEGEGALLHFFNGAIGELGKLRSIPVIDCGARQDAELVKAVKELKK